MTRPTTEEKVGDLQVRMTEVWNGVGLAGYVYNGQFRYSLENTICRVIREERAERRAAFWKEFRFWLPWLLLVVLGTWIIAAL